MIRLVGLFLGLGLLLALSACGETCESLLEEGNEIERKIERDPQSAMKYEDELADLLYKMQELECY